MLQSKGSKYTSMAEDSEDVLSREVRCARCYGTGEDDDGADCITCDGYGTILITG